MPSLTTPEAIASFRLRVLYRALRIEAETGLRHSQGDMLQVAASELTRLGAALPPLPRKRTARAARLATLLAPYAGVEEKDDD